MRSFLTLELLYHNKILIFELCYEISFLKHNNLF